MVTFALKCTEAMKKRNKMTEGEEGLEQRQDRSKEGAGGWLDRGLRRIDEGLCDLAKPFPNNRWKYGNKDILAKGTL